VIRYDHRDTGRSTTVDFSTHPYTLSDVAADAVGLLDAYSVDAAHLVGFSGGGMVAQTVALEHPDRVASLTSWGSTPLGASFVAPTEGGLPPPSREVVAAIARTVEPGLDEEERIESWVGMVQDHAGTLEAPDPQVVRALMKRMLAHTRDLTAFVNHHLAWAASPDRTQALGKVAAPALVIHGTADPIVPPAHGEATAEAIPGARLLTIDGMGHDFPRVALPRIVSAILAHTSVPIRQTRLGVVLPAGVNPAELIELARRSEELGFDSVWVPDGFADGHPATFTLMSAIAVSTERIEVGAYMLNASVYDPALLARAAKTLEQLAPGRVRAILGTGWDRKDYEALGQDFPTPKVRKERTRAALEMLKEETGISVEVAGVLDDVLDLAASKADGWALSSDALDAYFERAAVLRRACEQNGRRFDELRLSCTLPSFDRAEERIADLAEHDMGEFMLALNGEADRGGLEDLVRMSASYAGRAG
jgi:pimeloyl-ACP methyl ester carboxylesterase